MWWSRGRRHDSQEIELTAGVRTKTWVRDLAPNHSYRLQRAVDQTLDGDCTSTAWLTLGRGLEAREIATDDRGTGRADLFRSLAALPTGSQFDIHFQVIDAMTSSPVSLLCQGIDGDGGVPWSGWGGCRSRQTWRAR
jgi:hypothetical protein